MIKTAIGLTICLLSTMVFYDLPGPAELQAFQSLLSHSPLSTPEPPQRPEIALRDTTGETFRWPRFTDAGFTLRYPSDWEVRVLPDQVAGARIVEFAHSTSDGMVDATIQVWETWLSPNEDWEQDAELTFWREHSVQGNVAVEPMLVNGLPGWRVRTLHPVAPGTLAQNVLVGREGRLYRFRLYLYQDAVVEPYVRVLGLMMGTLRTRGVSSSPSTLRSTESMESPQALSVSPASTTVNYNRGAAYAYASMWWNRQNNDDGCYLWRNGSVLDCAYHSGDWGVDGAHFVNRAVAAGGRPIPGL